MKNKIPLLFILGLIISGLLVNSCKKDINANIDHLFVGGVWQLASIQVFHYVGSSQVGNADTLNTSCNSQFYTFNADNTSTYTNFDCLTQTSNGKWALTANRLFFTSDMVCKDTVRTDSVGTIMPFAYTKIVNLGSYSMVLETGDIQPNYSSTAQRTVTRYGFIRKKTATSTP